MNLLQLLIKEIVHRKRNALLTVLAVVVSAGTLIASVVVLKNHDLQTEKLLTRKKEERDKKLADLSDEMRKATLKLGFNLLIMPKDQNLRDWHAQDYASKLMPEAYVHKLAESGIVTVRHFLPILQQKIRWEEIKRTIILIGTKAEVPNLHKNPRKPLVQPVPRNTIVLGHELQRISGKKTGDTVTLLGREFTVEKCHEERGSKDDISAWIHLTDAQELLGKEGKINIIYALKCLCVGSEEIAMLRGKIARFLPDTQAIELGSRVVARAEARLNLKKKIEGLVQQAKKDRFNLRRERIHFASIIVPLVMIAALLLIGYLGLVNVKDRRQEIGILRAIGYRSGQIFFLFLSKSFLVGITGGILGTAGGLLGGYYLGSLMEEEALQPGAFLTSFNALWLWLTVAAATLLTIMGGWFPALLATQKDPAQILRKQE